MTFSFPVKRFSGTRHEPSRSLTSRSSSSTPSSTSRIASTAKVGLLIEPAWKTVSVSTESGEPASRIPTARAQAIRPPSITAMLTPGT